MIRALLGVYAAILVFGYCGINELCRPEREGRA